MIDNNKNVYKGKFATVIANVGVELEDAYRCVHKI